MWDVSMKLYLHKQAAGWIWPMGCCLPAHPWSKMTELQIACKCSLHPSVFQETQNYTMCWRAVWKMERTLDNFSEIPKSSMLPEVAKVTPCPYQTLPRWRDARFLFLTVLQDQVNPQDSYDPQQKRGGEVDPNLLFPYPCRMEAQIEIDFFGGDVPGGPVVKTLHFHCRGHEFDPWSGN